MKCHLFYSRAKALNANVNLDETIKRYLKLLSLSVNFEISFRDLIQIPQVKSTSVNDK